MTKSARTLAAAARSNIADLTSAQLVELFNALRPADTAEVKRFSDRKAAERRVLAVLPAAPVAKAAPAPRLGNGECPHCGADGSSITAAGPENTTLGQEFSFCHSCSVTWNNSTGKIRKDRSATNPSAAAAISASWADATVYAARITRHAVVVDGVTFKSVRAAFAALGLPMGRHISFRGLLKAEGEINAFGKQWAIIPASDFE